MTPGSKYSQVHHQQQMFHTYLAHTFHFKTTEVGIKWVVPFSQQWCWGDISCGRDCLVREPVLLTILLSWLQLLLLLSESLSHLTAFHLCRCQRRLGLLRPSAQVIHHSLSKSNSADGINMTKRGARPWPSHRRLFICWGKITRIGCDRLTSKWWRCKCLPFLQQFKSRSGFSKLCWSVGKTSKGHLLSWLLVRQHLTTNSQINKVRVKLIKIVLMKLFLA